MPFRFNSHKIRKIKNKHYAGILITEIAGGHSTCYHTGSNEAETLEMDREGFEAKLLSVYHQRMNLKTQNSFSAFSVVNPKEYQTVGSDSFESHNSTLPG